jgi:type II secretory pathway component GspD/PulD (secretin)
MSKNDYVMNEEEQEMHEMLAEYYKSQGKNIEISIALQMNVRGLTYGQAIEKLFEKI